MRGAGKGRLRVILVTALLLVVAAGVSAALLVRFANRIIKGELEKRLGNALSIERIDLKWGHVEASGIKLKNPAGRDVVRIGSLSARADFMQFFRREYVIWSLSLKDPYVFVEVNHQGDIVNPVFPFAPPPMLIRRLTISGGSIDYLDGKVRRQAVLTRVRDIRLEVGEVANPFSDSWSTFDLTAEIRGHGAPGVVKTKGKVKLKTMDMECGADVKGLDITGFMPYFQKNTDVNVTRGVMDVDMTVRVASGKVHAPGRAVLRNLDFAGQPGVKHLFMGVPLSLVMAFMKKGGDQIPLNFVVEGDLDNPAVNLREHIAARLSAGMAEKLGYSLKGMGRSMFTVGSEGTKGLGAGMKGMGKGLRKLFSK
jgi:hypothetical protein